MKQLRLVLFIALACLVGCTPKIKNDNSIGDVELKTYHHLAERLTDEMKRQFGGNRDQNDKITPEETADGIKIGIPGVVSYTFKKDNSKFVKGDLNHDQKTDLIIWADMTQSQGYQTRKYFVFLQDKEGYQYFVECKGDDMVQPNCRKADLNKGLFCLDSIHGGLLVGSTTYQGNHELSYLSYSYRCDTEKYKLNTSTKEVELVSQSSLLKKNDKTGVYEKVVVE